jgi:hypothetical protein
MATYTFGYLGDEDLLDCGIRLVVALDWSGILAYGIARRLI